MYSNQDGHLFGVNVEGESVIFEDVVSIDTLKDEGLQFFVVKLEKAIADLILQAGSSV